ncbi:MAG: ElyC/SanA/YdcF family protein [Candidatus Rickettsiella isopodorum]|nr:ElyC/SanA/YdcF family protein [Candidatus Rickettsiella isopodorum]MDD5342149.1 ElyC/SanA/YdcF family protein [Patescibacteria group bacterium]
MSIEKSSIERSEPETKREKYEALCGGQPDCLYVLGQGIVENPKSEKLSLKSASYTQIDYDGYMLGGKPRVIAAAELAGVFPEAKIVTNSIGSKIDEQTGERTTLSLASVMSQELQKMGVDPNKITHQEISYSVFTELIELIKLVVKNGWKNVAILTNEYQIPRIEAMLEHMEALHDPNGESEKAEFKQALAEYRKMDVAIKCVAAEEVLPLRSDHYRTLIDQVRQSEAWQARIARENEGAEQIRKGEYWKKLPEHFVKPEDLKQ